MASEIWWQRNGYLYGREIGGGLWICVAPMITTLRIMVCDEISVFEFWCYPYDSVSMGYVLTAAEEFNGNGDPAEGWVKHHPSGRRNEKIYINTSTSTGGGGES